MSIYSPWTSRSRHSRGGSGSGVDSNTVTLQHCNGANGASIGADEVFGISWNVMQTEAFLNTTYKKFGSAGLYYPAADNPIMGSSGAWAPYLTGTTTLTFEGWVYLGSIDHVAHLSLMDVAQGEPVRVSINFSQTGTHVKCLIDPIVQQVTIEDVNTVVAAGTWYHVAVTMDGNSWAFFFNGNRIGTATCTMTNEWDGMFASGTYGTAVDFIAFDDMRISKVVRYSGATYTIPTGELT